MGERQVDRRKVVGGALAVIGGLALPRPLAAQDTTDRARSAMDAAEELSVLEATAHIPALYTFYERLHPDAKQIVPRHVVIGWYQDTWLPMGPRPAVATGVRFTTWTWPGNGVTYTDVAEVSFTQQFANAPSVSDVVRLAFADGEWRWFFGRDKAWIDEQVAIYNQRAYIPQSGAVPLDLDRIVDAEPGVIQSLPMQIGAARGEPITDARQLPEYVEHMPVAIQYREAEFPVGYAMASTLRPGFALDETIERIVDRIIEAPPSRLIAWNLDPADGIPFAWYEHMASEAVGNARTITWGRNGTSTLWEISFVDDARLEELARAIVALAGA